MSKYFKPKEDRRYEVFDKITNKSYGIYTDLAIKKIGFNSIDNKETFEIKEVFDKTEADLVKEEGRY